MTVLSIAFFMSAGAPLAEDIDDPVYDNLKNMVTSEVQLQCKPGSDISQEAGTFSIAPSGYVVVRFAGFSCNWEYINHYFCGARACTTREYDVSGSDIRLVKEYLE
ncbi:MAG: hypothetical protein KUA43_09025 [Hoeflea sp.]|uniref:hypothetical protein n=1 Tax=Hoeflea sp. TaxID=1940281 RepID=UPI001DE65FBD|nr:hypothetical protein [Hoeflea sp.]MBU4528316.1 hypothetical protein [Alphaproteobacteria bacterium]MBU4542985.1 hypothetical protein [Alphaproteobacteria bacterium]MBU4551676.1 hypothetical protein [Alphaproteobacteria bacterium]MBV1723571.1 hypothetical protein [Hoeflea sp.]MBV1761887.1 hypothetical protein [Hoeflea sp.]